MTFDGIMKFLENHGSEQTKRVLLKHGALEPFYGVKVADLKVIRLRLIWVEHPAGYRRLVRQ
ncbi:MAG: hypothetical protein QNK33_10090 [Bacteroidales bacterium]|nr:hypothetical protein [Bacteroidales bacterium]